LFPAFRRRQPDDERNLTVGIKEYKMTIAVGSPSVPASEKWTPRTPPSASERSSPSVMPGLTIATPGASRR
jgi:hypothetical protein